MAENSAESPPVKSEKGADIETIMQLYRQYGRPLLFAVALSLLALVAVGRFRSRQESRRIAAAELYWSARTPQELQSLPEDYPSSPLAPLARLRAAKEHYDSGEFNRALNLYREFQEKHPDHLMIESARMGEWHSREGLGQTEEALRGFARFAEEHPDHFLTPQAILGQARCLETQGRFAEAKAVYDRALAEQRHKDWTDMFENRRKRLRRQRERTGTSVTIPIPPADVPSDREPGSDAPDAAPPFLPVMPDIAPVPPPNAP